MRTGPASAVGAFTVNSTADPGTGGCDISECTLREAILAANSLPGSDRIEFDIPGPGPYSIKPLTAFPDVTDPITLDGTTQPGFLGLPVIELDGTNVQWASFGLVISGGNSTIRGIAISLFSDGLALQTVGHNIVEGNFIGVDLTGTNEKRNYFEGLVVGYSSGDNVIGGTTAATRNVISGNGTVGIQLETNPYEQGNRIQGNYIGTDVTGEHAIANGRDGLRLESSSHNVIEGNLISGNYGAGVNLDGYNQQGGNIVKGNLIGTDVSGTTPLPNALGGLVLSGSQNVIGGTQPGEGNVISGNAYFGITISGGSARNLILGNVVGTDRSGSIPLGNGAQGVFISGADNVFGGISAGEANVVAFNRGVGIQVINASGNSLRGNRVYANRALGIDLGAFFREPDGVTANDPMDSDVGGNGLQNFPVITSLVADSAGLTASGELHSAPNQIFSIDIYANVDCDASGYGEGEQWLGVTATTTNGAGDGVFSLTVSDPLAGRNVVTATATDGSGNTSEFSACVVAVPLGGPVGGAVEVLSASTPTPSRPYIAILTVVAALICVATASVVIRCVIRR